MSSHPRRRKDSSGAGTSQDDSKDLLSGGGGLTRIRSGSGLERLPSLRPKRDLTLGGVPKKTFAPTIPTSRRVKKEPGEEGDESKLKPHVKESPKGKRRSSLDKKEGGGGGKGKEQRKKGKKDVITSASVFSMGPADRPMAGRTGGRIPGSFGAELAKRPGSSASKDGDSSNHYHRRDSAMEGGGEEEEEDDREDGASGNVEDLFAGSFLPPVQLPLDYSTHVKQRTLVAPSTKTVIKKIKQEPVDDLEEMDTSESSAVSASKHVRFAKAVTQPAVSEVKGHRVTAAELFTPSEIEKGKFLFIQLPDCLPISMATGKGTHQPMEVEKSSRASSIVTTASGASGASAVNSEGEPEQRHSGLADVPEGLIGKLRVHKSGKVKLSLGEVTLDVAMGTSCGFLQQLVSVRPNPPHSKMTVLGQLSHRLVCSPDFETMLQDTVSQREIEREPNLAVFSDS